MHYGVHSLRHIPIQVHSTLRNISYCRQLTRHVVVDYFWKALGGANQRVCFPYSTSRSYSAPPTNDSTNQAYMRAQKTPARTSTLPRTLQLHTLAESLPGNPPADRLITGSDTTAISSNLYGNPILLHIYPPQ